MKEDFNCTEFYQISFKTKKDWIWFYETLNELNFKDHIKMELKHLPAPIDILINEFEPTRVKEYRYIMGPDKTIEEIIDKFREYLQWICPNNNHLIIVDKYFFNNIDNMVDIIKKIFNKIKIRKITIITEPNNIPGFDIFKNICNDQDIKVSYRLVHGLHDRYYLSDSGKGFLCGTSFNGIGKHESTITHLPQSDCKILYAKYKKISNLPVYSISKSSERKLSSSKNS